MATNHTYPFECGHNARADNNYVMTTSIIVTAPRKDGTKQSQSVRFCPACHKRVARAISRCFESGRNYQSKKRLQALPPLED